jgi:hypothetical protein
VADGGLTVEGAYRRAGDVVRRLRIDDLAFYERVRTELYGRADERVQAGTLADAR